MPKVLGWKIVEIEASSHANHAVVVPRVAESAGLARQRLLEVTLALYSIATEVAEVDEIAMAYEKEMLFIHPSDHPSLTLTSAPLTRTNFLGWSQVIYVLLGVKMKLGFIDGTFPKPTTGSTTFEQWKRVDLMVTSWIWQSISKDLVRFRYLKYAIYG
ncbi:UNVERIFIED_CONTAM: hypothetical protein Sradi_6663600 [Sesamum radiatum]|uniref:Retrotransposon Copia-like N-terminal domain-containing protein n=1 Tax=Sesamum radiatum TaxID=300843 RepID=A0AAW2JNR7_SESRA